MKKLLFIAAALLTQLAAGAQTLLEADFNNEADFTKWTVVDANNDGSTWKFDAETTDDTHRCVYTYNNDNDADDWLMSPAITPATDCTVLITFTAKAGGDFYSESMDAYTGSAPTVEAMTTKGAALETIHSTPLTGTFFINAKAGVPFYIGLHATSPKNLFRLYLQSMKATVGGDIVDLSLSSLLSPTTGSGLAEEAVKISVENKGTTAIPSYKVFYSIDGGTAVEEQVNTPLAAGATAEYTFTAKADLSTPRHTYTIKTWVEADGDIIESNNSLTTLVKHEGPITLPYKLGFEEGEDLGDLHFYDVNNDSFTWHVLTNSFFTSFTDRGQRCLGVGYNSNDKTVSADDWAILGPISITEAGYYSLKFWYAADERHPEKLAVYWGNGVEPEAMTNKVVEYAPFLSPLGYTQSVNIINVAEPQNIYIGFHGFSDANENWLTIDDIEVAKVDNAATDVAIKKLTSPAEYIQETNSLDLKFTVANMGVTAVNATATVTVDGQLMTTRRNISLTGQQTRDISYPNALYSLTEGEHTVEVTVTADGDTDPSNNTITRTVNVLPTAQKFWDFEDGKLPSDFTFRAEDEGTINPAAGDFTDNMSWELLETDGSNLQIGRYLLSGTSYIDGVSTVDRWVILPRTDITDDRWVLAWDARAFNDRFVESYEVKVSDTEDSRWEYSTLLSVPMEDAENVQTRGKSLASYAGKSVYLAFRLNSRPGDRLLLDNIGLYHLDTTAGISSATADSAADITFDGTTAYAPAATLITVSDVAGRTVLTAHGTKANLAALPQGLYIVKADTGKSIKVKK